VVQVNIVGVITRNLTSRVDADGGVDALARLCALARNIKAGDPAVGRADESVSQIRFSSNLLNCSRPHSLDEVGIGRLAPVLPDERGDLSAVVDTVKRDVQCYVA
jgi:hypothetical protein